MKVLQVSTHLNIGGIGNYILGLSSALKGKGADVIVASSGGNLEGELGKCGVAHRYIGIDTKFELHPKVFIAAFKLTKIARDEKIDMIHAHSRVSQAASLFAARMAGVPLITTCHGYFKKRSRGIFDTWGDKVVAISDAVREHLINDLGVKEERIELIYNGVDTNRFSKAYTTDEVSRIKKSLGLKAGPVIGTIGRLSPVKGQRFLIEAMTRIIQQAPGAQCLIVGSGEEESALRSLAGSLGLGDVVYFVPSDPDTHKFLSIMDVFVFPSVKEGLGLALLEALASGKACVASRVGGISDIIEDGNSGILVNVEDTGAIADAVKSILANPDAGCRMGIHGRQTVADRFSIETMADKTIELYKRTVRVRHEA